jgi:hypothetical protein
LLRGLLRGLFGALDRFAIFDSNRFGKTILFRPLLPPTKKSPLLRLGPNRISLK